MIAQYSGHKFENYEITTGESLFKRIINERLSTCNLLIDAKPNVQLVILINLINSKEAECLSIRKAMVRDLAFFQTEVSSYLISHWLTMESDVWIRYTLYCKLMYNVQHQDETAYVCLTTLLHEDAIIVSNTIRWLRRYPSDRVLAGKVYETIKKQKSKAFE